MDYHFTVVIFMCCNLYSIISASNIIVDPQNTDTFEGANVTLYCTVQNLGGNTVVWRDFDTGTEYSQNRTIVAPSDVQPGRYRITGNDTEGTFNLEITGITKSLNHNTRYQCTIPGANVFGKKAEIKVYNMPSSPTCSVPRRNNDFVEGENVEFECTFESALPKVEMNLTRNGITLSSEIVNPDLNVRRSTFSTNFTATSDDNGALLECSVDHQILSIPVECKLEKLNVMHKPMVEILSNGTASFTCDAVSNPDATKFEWSLCLENTNDDCFQLGKEKQLRGMDPVTDFGVCGLNASCHSVITEMSEHIIGLLINDNFTYQENENFTNQENITVTECSLKCSVNNFIGEGQDDYNTTCLITNRSIIILITSEDQNSIMEDLYFYIIGGVSGCVCLFVCTMIIIKVKNKTGPTESSTTATHMNPNTNDGHDRSDKNQKENVYSENKIKGDEKVGNTSSKNPSESTPQKDGSGDVLDSCTLRRDGDSNGPAPLYSSVNKQLKSSGRTEPPPDVLLRSENGLKYTNVDFSGQPQLNLSTIKGIEGSTAYAELDYKIQL